MKKILIIAIAAAMSLAAMASTAPVYAMPMFHAGGAGFTDVRFDHGGGRGGFFHRGGGWGHGGWGHDDWGRGGGGGWWIGPAAGLITGAIIGNALSGPPVYERVAPAGNAHVEWCYEHHPSYNPNTNTFRDAYGGAHVCYAPV